MRLITASLLLLLSHCLSSQSIHYSHQLVRNWEKDAVLFMSNIGAKHHLLIMGADKKPKVYVYDMSLQLKAEQEMPVKIYKSWVKQFIQLKDHYYMFLRLPQKGSFQLWKIDANGIANDMTPVLQQMIKDSLLHHNTTMYLFSDSNHLHIATCSASLHPGQLQLRHLLFNSESKALVHDQIMFPSNSEQESLQQISLINDRQLLLLKSTRNKKAENLLEVIKCNLNTGQTETNQLNFHWSSISAPLIVYNSFDSSIILRTIVRNFVNRYIFISRIKHLPLSVVPTELPALKGPFSYVFMNGVKEYWFDFSDPPQKTYQVQFFNNTNMHRDFQLESLTNRFSQSSQFSYARNYNTYNSHMKSSADQYNFSQLEFYSVDHQFELSEENSFITERKNLKVMPQETGITEWKNKSLLFMKHMIRKKRTGLIMIYNDQQLKAVDLSVYEQYDYLLKQMRTCNDGSIVIPYINKRETGLMRLRWTQIGEG